jgi:hypothetical protein
MVSALTDLKILVGMIVKVIVEHKRHANNLWQRESFIKICQTPDFKPKNPNWNYNMSTNRYKLGRKSG